MIVYRIVNEKYALDLSGNGAKLNGGRWNSEGNPALYVSSHISLAYLEILVNANYDQLIKAKFKVMSIDISLVTMIESPSTVDLPFQWDSIMITTHSQRYGDSFLISRKALMLKIPSAVVPEEYNYMINPLHADISKIKIIYSRDFFIDSRISKANTK